MSMRQVCAFVLLCRLVYALMIALSLSRIAACGDGGMLRLE
jgi:hypothetical protein